MRTALKTAEGVVDGDVYVLQLLGENTSVPVQSLLHVKSSEVLDGDTDNYINSVFTTNNLTSNNSIKSNGTLTVEGHTTLATLTATDTTVSGALTIAGNTNAGGDLTVSGSTTLSDAVHIYDELTVDRKTFLTGVYATEVVEAPLFVGDLSGNASTASN